MATTTNNNQVFISRTDSGFPAYLDFASLRTNAINYLGPITASYWTDYNIHDPGITTLEALLYALMDLGYRANFPIADLLTPAPGDTTKYTDFFTPGHHRLPEEVDGSHRGQECVVGGRGCGRSSERDLFALPGVGDGCG